MIFSQRRKEKEYLISQKEARGWCLNSSFTMWRPVGSQLLIDVVVKPGHEGEHCDGNSCWDSEHPDWSPDGQEWKLQKYFVILMRKRLKDLKYICWLRLHFYLPEWRHRRSQTSVNMRPENSLKGENIYKLNANNYFELSQFCLQFHELLLWLIRIIDYVCTVVLTHNIVF